MEVTALLFRLLMFEFFLLGTQVQDSYTHSNDAGFLRIFPNRLQHSQLDSVSFDCGGFDAPTQLRRSRNSTEFNVECDDSLMTGFSCTIERVYPLDSGVYWCETAGGERSNSVNISVTDGFVILDILADPVTEENNVTLRCRNRTNSTATSADFYKDGLLKDTSAEEMTIYSVSTSDEGLYMCNISGVGASPESWLAVRAPDKKSVPPASNLWWIAVIISVTALLLLLLVGLILYIWKCREADESSVQPVYSTLTTRQPHRAVPPGSGSSRSTVSPAASGPKVKERDMIYSLVQMATESRDT